MTEKIHGINCDCCIPESIQVQDIITKVNEIVGRNVKEKAPVMDQLVSMKSTLKEFGGIDDIYDICKAFLDTPVESIPVSKILLDDPNKKIGSFLVKDLSDVPTLDITKVIDFSKLNISKLSSLVFSISVPTIVAVKAMKFGLINIKMKFFITRTSVSWMPLIEMNFPPNTSNPWTGKSLPPNINNRENAMKVLDGVKSLQPLQPSKVSLDKAKLVASKYYGKSTEVQAAIESSITVEDFFNQLSNIGVVLQEEVDIHAEMQKILDMEAAYIAAEPFEHADCSTYPLVPAPYTAEELREIEKDCCTELTSDEVVIAQNETDQLQKDKENAKKQIDDILSNNGSLTDKEEADDLNDVDNFLTCTANANSIIQKAALEKQNALNSFYWFMEVAFLNEMNFTYSRARMETLDSLIGSFETLEAERIRRIEKSIEFKRAERQYIFQAYNELSTAGVNGNLTLAAVKFLYGEDATLATSSVLSTSPDVLDIQFEDNSGTNQLIRADQLALIESNPIYSYDILQYRNLYNDNEIEITNITAKIENLKSQNQLPTFTEAELLDIKTVDLKDSSSVIGGKVSTFRGEYTVNNIITNQAGYGYPGSESILLPDTFSPPGGDAKITDYLQIYVHPNIYNECKVLFALNSPETGDLGNYVQKLAQRKGLFASMIWDKYYNPNRIDKLFTYLEQGYTSPKPLYDDNGNALGPKTTVTIPNTVGGSPTTQQVAQSVLDLGVDEPVAIDFWPNIEAKTFQKIQSLLNQLKSTPQYANLIRKLEAAGIQEAKITYAANLVFQETSYSSREFNSYTQTFNFNTTSITNSLIININTNSISTGFRNMYKISYDSLNDFQKALEAKQADLNTFIESKKKVFAEQENAIAACAEAMNKKTSDKAVARSKKNTGVTPLSGPGPVNDECPPKLGSDPLGLKPSGNCPGPDKNCYWKEYTKKMQLVSIMPIPDVQFLTKRLFRYYSVAIQIPVPSPAPVVLPTLASGIPDPMISIPIPFIWKHIVSIQSPVGLFVVWIAMCGPIPCPYVLYIDEKTEPAFLVTPKGPIVIPAKSLGVLDAEEKTLLEYLSPLDKTFKVSVLDGPFKNMMGCNNLDLDDPDTKKSFMDGVRSKIKDAINSIEGTNPSWALNTPEMKRKREKLKKAFKNFPPDINAVEDAFRDLESLIDKEIDSLNISDMKFPKDAKKLVKPVIGPAEFMDQIKKLLDAAIDPAELGLGLKMISLKDELKKQVDRALSDPSVISEFNVIDKEISVMENKFKQNSTLDDEKIKQRSAKVRKVMKVALEKVASTITPESLGFVAFISVPIPLPAPCYGKATIDPVPPYISAILAAIKALPNVINALSDDALVNSLSKFINMGRPLPNIDKFAFFAIQSMLSFAPDLRFPDPASANMLKQIIATSIQNVFKLKIMLPHVGSIGITIPSTLIKSLIKKGVKLAIIAIAGIILEQLYDSLKNKDFIKVLVAAAIIKAVFGTDLSSLKGNDIKAFITGSLAVVDQQLGDIENLLINIPKIDFKSIKETLMKSIPPKIELVKPPYLEVGLDKMLTLANPLLKTLENVPLPFPVVLLGCTTAPSRLALSKLNPFSAKELLPSWEKMSMSNIPYVIFLDQLIATAQRSGGIFSDYVVPYYLPDV